MKASTMHKISLRNAMKPVMDIIKCNANDGRFGAYFLDRELICEVRNRLVDLGYRVEIGGSGKGYYVFW